MDLVRSPNDAKQYRLLRLETGLEVVLVSSLQSRSSSIKAAAAVAVQVGSFSDPVEIQGLAHFVEHMVFMGSTAYPVENHYDSFIHSHGGECNAMTEGEYTVYQFSISYDYLSSALDIFANCLLHPLFNTSSMERELNAIESEFSLALADDGARLQQLLGASAKDGHVLKKFSWGNEYSLKTVPEQHHLDVNVYLRKFHATHYLPENMKLVIVAGKSLDEMEASLYQSAFARSSPAPPSSLRELPLPTQTEMLRSMGLPLPLSAFKQLYRIIPTRKTHKLLVSWQMPSILKDYRSKSAQYLCHLLGHEGPGSLLSELKRVGFSSAVSAGVTDGCIDNNSMFAVFNVTVSLTPKGLANWFEVVTLLFAYLHMLCKHGPQEWVYEELRDMAEIDFAHLEEEEEEEFAERVAVEMLPYRDRQRDHLLYANYMFAHFNAQAIAALNNLLMNSSAARFEILSSSYYISGRVEAETDDPETEWEDVEEGDDEDDDMDDGESENDDDEEDEEDGSLFNVGASEDEESDEDLIDGGNGVQNITPEELQRMYTGPQHLIHLVLPPTDDKIAKKRTPEVEPYFGTLYWVDAIPDELLDQWSRPTPCPRLELPPRNHFIPQDFALVDSTAASDGNASASTSGSVFTIASPPTLPTKLIDLDGFVLWHIVHPMHRTPKVEAYFAFSSYRASASPLSAAMNDLFVRVISDSLAELAYMASMAGIDANIFGNDVGMTIHISGFSDKSLLLLQSIIEALLIRQNITSERVERQLELLCRAYENENMKASKSASNARLSALKPSKFSTERKLTQLKGFVGNEQKLLEELVVYADSFFSAMSSTALIAGNLSSEAVNRFGGNLLVKLGAHKVSLSSAARPLQPIVSIPPSTRPFLLHVMPNNVKEKNTCVEFYFQQGPFDMHRLTMLDLLEQMISEPCFDDLRTKQQLGYHVECDVRQTFGVLGFCFTVVTSSHSAEEVQNAIFKFASSTAEFLMKYSDDGFVSNVNALRDRLLQLHPSLSIAARDIWTEIEESRFAFNHATMQAALLSTIKREELAAFANALFCSERKLLIVHSSVEDNILDHDSAAIRAAFDLLEKPEDLHRVGTHTSLV